jgi:hypothetical protein
VPSSDKYRGPHGEQIQQRLESFRVGLDLDLSLALELAPDETDSLIGYLLGLACQAQHIGNIQLGRHLLAELPRDWLLARIEKLAATVLPLHDPWEFRRLLEVYTEISPSLGQRLAEAGLKTNNPEIREAAEDFRGAGP